jgi:hypothetical protein
VKAIVVVAFVAILILSAFLVISIRNNDQLQEELTVRDGYIDLLISINGNLNGELATLQAEMDSWRFDFRDTKLLEFYSVDGLEQWLADDPISEREWVETTYDCDDFAVDLSEDALADGYWIGLGIMSGHMFNFTIIGNDIYRIEASTDVVTYWGEVD